MTRTIAGTALAAMLALALLGACAPVSPLDEHWGDGYREHRDAMIANPDAGHQPAPEGIDPSTAEHVLENYEKGQKAQEHRRPRPRRSTGIIVGEIGN